MLKENGGNFGNQNTPHYKVKIMKVLAVTLIFVGLWIAFEMWRAPMMDEETGKIIKPGKKISDLWRKRS